MKAFTIRLVCTLVLITFVFQPIPGLEVKGARQTLEKSSEGERQAINHESIEAVLENAKAIAAGSHFNCALTELGGVKCWGSNSGGQLGDGTKTSRMLPVDEVGLHSGVISIESGYEQTCVITSGG